MHVNTIGKAFMAINATIKKCLHFKNSREALYICTALEFPALWGKN